ncbi:MAG: PDZ domain-containing protein [Sinimarinibacterium sp.]|jgi:S1-C subfamily serine protease
MNRLSLSLCAASLLVALNVAPLSAADAPVADKAEAADIERARAEFKRAQAELARAAGEMARVSRELHIDSPRAYAYEFVTDPDRAMLGVTIANADEKDGKRAGVRVTGVTPRSGADDAGLKSGDLLLSANGTALASAGDDEREPVERLRDVMNGLKPGDKVKVDYERDGRRTSATVTASRPQESMLPMLGWQDDEDFDVLVPPVPPHAPMAAAAMRLHHGGADFGLQLARIDDDLAAYFKTKDGVLVVRAPDGGTLGLKSGDVIRKINGRSVASPVAAWEELADAKNQPVKMTVLRQSKELSLEGILPESSRRHVERHIVIKKEKDE